MKLISSALTASFFALAILTLPNTSASAAASPSDPAITFVNNLADQFINKIFAKTESTKNMVSDFREVFAQNCDIPFISKFVLGKANRTATDEEKSAFTKAFSENVVLTWAGRFKEYSGQTISVKGTRAAQSGQIYVDSEVVSPTPNAKPIALVWRLKNNDGSYQIADLIIEGVSMVMTYRSEYSAILQKSGGDIKSLTDTLLAKNKTLAASLGV